MRETCAGEEIRGRGYGSCRSSRNTYVALHSLNPTHTHFTVVDLTNAYFCLPLAPHVKDWFAFTYDGIRYTYNRLPQGYKDSPGLFNHALREELLALNLPPDTTLIQYVDDLQLAGTSADSCLLGTRILLNKLAEIGYKI